MDTNDVLSLKRTTRDIIAISSLPSIWTHYNVHQVAASLTETLFHSLSLEFAFVQIKSQNETFETAFNRTGSLENSELERLTAKLAPILDRTPPVAFTGDLDVVSHEAPIVTNFTTIGRGSKHGMIVTAARRADFPMESDRLILNIASNQMYVTLEAKLSQKEAELAKLEAERANELKSSFLANMSHEIRTPLGAILGFTDVLKNSNLNSKERSEYLEIITRSGQSLIKIIDDILDLSKIEAGKLEIETLPILVGDVGREVVAMFSDRAVGKGVDLIFNDASLPKFNVNSDQIRIRQILVNLIGNAVKFTSQGSITVSGSFSELSEGLLKITLTVADTGVGMSKMVSEGLFKPFMQGDNTSTRKFGGTGLGLALSKKLGNALGGDVYLSECEENKGCTFTFDFVARKSEMESTGARENVVAKPKVEEVLKGLRVLVADDSADNRLLLQLILTKHGAHVELAEDGEDAVERALASDFHAILMDIQMPGLDGYGALAKLRKANMKKPILALTAHAMNEDRNRAIASGFADHVSKPINPKALIQSLLTHASRA